MNKLTARIELKLSESTFATLQEIEKKHALSPQVVCRALADAAAAYFEKNGRFGFPVMLLEETLTTSQPVEVEPATATGSSRRVQLKKSRDNFRHLTEPFTNADSTATEGAVALGIEGAKDHPVTNTKEQRAKANRAQGKVRRKPSKR